MAANLTAWLGNGKQAASSTTLVLTYTNAPAVGKHVVIDINFPGAQTINSVTDSAGNTYQIDCNADGANGNGHGIVSAKITNTITAGSTTVTITLAAASTNWHGSIFQMDGAHATAWLGGKSAPRVAWETARSTPSMTPNVAGSLVIGFFGSADTGETNSITVGSGWTFIPMPNAHGYENFATPTGSTSGVMRNDTDGTTAYTPTATGGFSWYYNGVGVWYKPSAVATYTKTGLAASAGQLAGSKTATLGKKNIAIAAAVAAGIDLEIRARAGAVIAAGAVAGSKAQTLNEKNILIADSLVMGSKSRQASRLGLVMVGEISGYGSYEGGYVGTPQNGAILSGVSVKGAGIKAGLAVASLIASGADAITRPRTGMVTSDTIASGGDATLRARTGAVVSVLVAAGAKLRTLAGRTGSVVSALATSAPDVALHAETGTMISAGVASGVATKTGGAPLVKAGAVISALVASAWDATVRARTGLVALGSPQAYRDVILGSVPISYWRLNETANPAVDEMGVQNGTYGGGTLGQPGLLTGDANQAWVGTGTGTGVIMGNNAPYQISIGTLEAWIKTADAGALWRGIIAKEGAYAMYLYGNVLVAYDWGTSGNKTSGVNLSDNVRHHVVFTFQSGVVGGSQFYVDGVAVGGVQTYTVPSGTVDPVKIGNNGDIRIFNGTIDEPAIYGRVLSPAEILAHYNAGITPGVGGGAILSGADVAQHAETGSAVSSLVVAGAKLRTYAGRTGAAISALVAAASDVAQHSRAGTVISNAIASGMRSQAGTKSGIVISAASARATDAVLHERVGSAILSAQLSAADAAQLQRAGIVNSTFIAKGQDVSTFTEAGKLISELLAAGADTHVAVEIGILIAQAVAAGVDIHQVGKERWGTVVAGTKLAGFDISTFVRTGTAMSDAEFYGEFIRKYKPVLLIVQGKALLVSTTINKPRITGTKTNKPRITGVE